MALVRKHPPVGRLDSWWRGKDGPNELSELRKYPRLQGRRPGLLRGRLLSCRCNAHCTPSNVPNIIENCTVLRIVSFVPCLMFSAVYGIHRNTFLPSISHLAHKRKIQRPPSRKPARGSQKQTTRRRHRRRLRHRRRTQAALLEAARRAREERDRLAQELHGQREAAAAAEQQIHAALEARNNPPLHPPPPPPRSQTHRHRHRHRHTHTHTHAHPYLRIGSVEPISWIGPRPCTRCASRTHGPSARASARASMPPPEHM